MAIERWKDDDEEITGEYVQDNDFPVIPHDTRVKACIDKVSWEFKTNYKNKEENEHCISVRFDIEEGEFKGQKIFKKFFIESTNDDQAVKDYRMFLNIDVNAGGKIRALRRKPTDEDLSKYLINKSMIVVVGMMTDKVTKKQSNYLMGISSLSSSKSSPPRRDAKPSSNQTDESDIDEQDLPF